MNKRWAHESGTPHWAGSPDKVPGEKEVGDVWFPAPTSAQGRSLQTENGRKRFSLGDRSTPQPYPQHRLPAVSTETSPSEPLQTDPAWWPELHLGPHLLTMTRTRPSSYERESDEVQAGCDRHCFWAGSAQTDQGSRVGWGEPCLLRFWGWGP